MPICDIFNQSISQGTFPDDWKYARVTPLYKQGDRGDVNNYRPISVIAIVAKVFERIVYDSYMPIWKSTIFYVKINQGFVLIIQL